MGKYIDNFDYLCEEIDQIFSIPNMLRDQFVAALRDRARDSKINFPQRRQAENALAVMQSISDGGIRRSYADSYKKLYENGLVLIISSSEMILRDIYDELFNERFDTIPSVKKVNISVEDFDFDKAPITKNDVVQIVKRKLYEDKNPSTKLYFENIKALESQFLNSFNIRLGLSETHRHALHKFYQFRHILIHQRGKVDQIFIDNLKIIDLDIKPYSIGSNIEITERDYEDCKKALRKLIETIETKIN